MVRTPNVGVPLAIFIHRARPKASRSRQSLQDRTKMHADSLASRERDRAICPVAFAGSDFHFAHRACKIRRYPLLVEYRDQCTEPLDMHLRNGNLPRRRVAKPL